MEYEVVVLRDDDWGFHRADTGYFIRVVPNVDFPIVNSPWRESIPEACAKLGHNLIFWGDVEEGCEDECPESLKISKLADEIVSDTYEKVELALSDEQVSQIDTAYPGRDNKQFSRFWSVWRKKC